MSNEELDVINLFKGLTPNQAKELTDKIGKLLPELRKEVVGDTQPSDGILEYAPQEAEEKQIMSGEFDEEKIINDAELEELSHVPRGRVGIARRSNINAKYEELRHGKRVDGSLAWLEAEREKNNLSIPETDDQRTLLESYREAIRPWKGNVRRISNIQAQFRAKGLKV